MLGGGKEFKNFSGVARYLCQAYTGTASIGSSYSLQSKVTEEGCVSQTNTSIKVADAFDRPSLWVFRYSTLIDLSRKHRTTLTNFTTLQSFSET